ncbi:glucokinase [Ideonella sp. BN130291]|uniref:glucokinase n=1 Tax=Ideonella sp. BN130291 TaxID=3112940 RepID=UPI002E267EF7|nr:glucokinase [Ideonella sp. BN130291]
MKAAMPPTLAAATAPRRRLGDWALSLLVEVGGTHIRLALADAALPGVLMPESIRRYQVADFPRLADAAWHYGAQLGCEPAAAVVAAAGPVDGERVHLAHHPWTLERSSLQAALGLEDVLLVNDFAALAACIGLLGPGDVMPLCEPDTAPDDGGARMHAVIGPGHGLGVAGAWLQGGEWRVWPTEGGHAALAPADEMEVQLLRVLSRRFGRVSYERVLSGPGLRNLFLAQQEIQGHVWLEPPSSEEIVAGALGDNSECIDAVERFCLLLAGFAGDMTLCLGAWQGTYLVGSLLQSLQAWLQAPRFRERFVAKARLRNTLERVPLRQVLHPEPALLGAAALARQWSLHAKARAA